MYVPLKYFQNIFFFFPKKYRNERPPCCYISPFRGLPYRFCKRRLTENGKVLKGHVG